MLREQEIDEFVSNWTERQYKRYIFIHRLKEKALKKGRKRLKSLRRFYRQQRMRNN